MYVVVSPDQIDTLMERRRARRRRVRMTIWWLILALEGLVIMAVVFAEPVQAHPHAYWVQASAYGPCCYEDVGGGDISYDGQRGEGLTPWKSSVASPYLRRGNGICIEIPPQRQLDYHLGLQKHGAVICDRPLIEAAAGVRDHQARGPLTVSDHIPIYHSAQGERWDLSRGFLDDIGFCHAGEADFPCLKRWGVRAIKIHWFG